VALALWSLIVNLYMTNGLQLGSTVLLWAGTMEPSKGNAEEEVTPDI